MVPVTQQMKIWLDVRSEIMATTKDGTNYTTRHHRLSGVRIQMTAANTGTGIRRVHHAPSTLRLDLQKRNHSSGLATNDEHCVHDTTHLVGRGPQRRRRRRSCSASRRPHKRCRGQARAASPPERSRFRGCILCIIDEFSTGRRTDTQYDRWRELPSP